MQQTVTIECPPEILLGLHLNAEGFADYLKKQATISLLKRRQVIIRYCCFMVGY